MVRNTLGVAAALFFAACSAQCGAGGTISGSAEMGTRSQPRTSLGPAAACLDGVRALAHVGQLAALSPRHPGSPGIEKTRAYIGNALLSYGLRPNRQEFTAQTPHPDFAQVKMANFVVDIGPAKGKKVLVAGHYDAKFLAGIDFKAANDGGSSTALLLELARCLSLHPPVTPVRLAFLDGEEAFVAWSESDSLYGSRSMAAEIRARGEESHYAAVVVVDMIGDLHLQIVREQHSTPWVFEALRVAAVDLNHAELFQGASAAIEDDHVPFVRLGIPAAVLIDLTYGPGGSSNAYWHTAADTPDKLSPQNMVAVGQIVLHALPALVAGPPRDNR